MRTFFIARDHQQAQDTKAILSHYGLKSHVFSPIAVEYASNGVDILDNISLFDGMIFTSLHAVRALDFYPKNISMEFKGVVFAVGETTAKALKEYGFQTVIHPETEVVASLVEYIKMAQCHKFLYLAGKERKDYLETALLSYDLTVQEVYEVVPISKISNAQKNMLYEAYDPQIVCFSKRLFEITLDLMETAGFSAKEMTWHIVSRDKEPVLKGVAYKYYETPKKFYETVKHS